MALGTIADVLRWWARTAGWCAWAWTRCAGSTLGIAELARGGGAAERINAWTVVFTAPGSTRLDAWVQPARPRAAANRQPGSRRGLAQYLERLNRERQRQVKRCLELARRSGAGRR